MGKISKAEAESRRKKYIDEFPSCRAILIVGRGLKLCGCRRASCHHLARGRLVDEYEQPDNYLGLGDPPACSCHAEWGHAGKKIYTEDDNRVWGFALKFALGEATIERIRFLMKGRSWWKPEDGEDWSLEDEIRKRAEILRRTLVNFPKKKLARKGGLNVK